MKKNGFTLVELLGVITILAMLGIIVVPVVSNIISNNKQKLYDVQIKNIKNAAADFVADNAFSIDIPSNSSLGIRLGKLKELGYIDNDISNPNTKTKFDDSMLIIIRNYDSNYSYVVCDGTVNCSGYVSVYGE